MFILDKVSKSNKSIRLSLSNFHYKNRHQPTSRNYVKLMKSKPVLSIDVYCKRIKTATATLQC